MPLTHDQLIALKEIIDDELVFTEVNLKISDKMGRCIPLRYNKQQLALWREIYRQEQAGQPVRIIVLKARQMGISTATAAMFYYRAITKTMTNAIIVSHQADAAGSIFEKVKMFYDHSHPYLMPLRKASNAREVVFANPTTVWKERRDKPGMNSKIEIETAVNKNVARGKTIHLLHASELAFWPYPDETLTSAFQALPLMPGTIAIIESTANGVGGRFYEEWKRAERGENGFTPIFFPWHSFDEYRMAAPKDFSPTEEEAELIATFSVDAEQLTWRRWCIANNCGGSLDVFHQEYPMTPDEAFIASGRPVFDVKAIDKAMQAAVNPSYIGRVVEVQLHNDKRVEFQTMYNGYLSIWEKPQDGAEYVIGIDVALGKAAGDYSCMQVVRKDNKKQVAEWHGHIDPDELGREAVYLGRYYNMALLVPERNNHGIATIGGIRRYRYPRIYRQRNSESKVEQRVTFDYGFLTTGSSKPQIIGELQRVIRENAERIQSKRALSECLTYVIDDSGKTNAQNGCFDDRVMSLALAYYCLSYRDFAEDAPVFTEVPIERLYQVNSTTGY